MVEKKSPVVSPMEMDNGMESSSNLIVRGGKAGYFVSKTTAIVLAVGVVATIVIVGVIVHVAGPQPVEVTPSVTTPPVTTPKPTQKLEVRLPTDLNPILYTISLQPYIDEDDGEKKFTFDGNVQVKFNVTKETSIVILHINNIHIKTAPSLKKENGDRVEVGHWKHENETQFFKLPTKKTLKKGETYILNIKYTGELTDKLIGFYRSSYKKPGPGNVTQYLATTQFQPTDARRAFPCMDEPGMKARFKITIKCREKYTAISNTKSETVTPEDGFKTFVFEETVPMSTYLVAFVVSDFKHTYEQIVGTNITVGVWAREEALKTTKYALEKGKAVLKYFGEFFKEPFPLKKQDMIAVPDFNAGAMENWGLVTYRETALLYDPNKSSLSDKQRVNLVVSHELAHQWFGNLVTPKWWDDLWLNEGFASFVENLGIDETEPSLKIMEQFVCNELQPVLVLDSLASSHPIYQKVDNPNEINELFDSISYSKGASIIRMMDFYLGRENFRNGLQKYLDAMKYRNAESADLWTYLDGNWPDKGKAESVKDIMDTWTTQMGYPVVTITKSGTTATVTQGRFLLDSKSERNGNSETNEASAEPAYKWEIPFSYTTATGTDWNTTKARKNIKWMNKDGGKLTLTELGKDDWIVGNVAQMGFYRVNYDDSTWKKIIAQLKKDHTVFDHKNRAQIIDDAFNLARANLIDYKTAFETTEYLKDEEHFVPWASAVNAMSYVDDVLSTTEAYGHFQKYMMKIGRTRYTELTFVEPEDEDPLKTYLRSKMISLMCGAGDGDCLKKAKDELDNWIKEVQPPTTALYSDDDPQVFAKSNATANAAATTAVITTPPPPPKTTKPAPPPSTTKPAPPPSITTPEPSPTPVEGVPQNIRQQVYCYGVAAGGLDEWEFIFAQFKKEGVAAEKKRLMRSMSCSTEPWILKRLLKMSLKEGGPIRKQDATTLIQYVAGNHVGISFAWDFIRSEWATLLKNFGESMSFSRLILRVTNTFADEFKLEELTDFIKQNPNAGSGQRAFDQAVEKTRANIKWIKDNLDEVSTWLQKAVKP